MLIIVVLLSILITTVAIVVGLFLFFTTPPQKAGQNGDKKTSDEVKSVWQYLGLVDDTPNMFRAVVAGNEDKGPIIGYITNLDGVKYDPQLKRTVPLKIVGTDAKGNPIFEDVFSNESWFEGILRKRFGKRVYGVPFLNNIRPLEIDRVVRAKTATPEQTNLAKQPTQKIPLANQLSASSVKRYGLKEKIFRPTYHDDLDTTDGTRFSVISYATLRVFNPEPAFIVYSDDLLPNISEIISGLISLKVLPNDWEYYKKTGKEIQPHELDYLNHKLEPMGVEITQLTMSDPEVNADMQASLEEEKKAERTAAAKRKLGEGERDFIKLTAEGKALGIERLAKAKASRFKELVDLYTSRGISDRTAVEMANDLIAKEFTAKAIAKLTGTYAPGLGSGVIGLGGEKK